ncbi:MAG: extracellular solute-binding protein [Lachnospiraceae bacterium]|nr:extracellular solute-binding protein [Lachnospiraceae bacterium]
MKQKRLMALLLSCSMLAAAMTGCGNSNEGTSQESKSTEQTTSGTSASESSKAESSQAADSGAEAFDPKSITDGVKLTIAVKDSLQIADYNTNFTTLSIEEALGVDLEFIPYASADYETKMNVMVMSGDELPDIIFNPGDQYLSWANEGAIISLNEYYENPDMSANFLAACEKMGTDVYPMMKNADGLAYYVPYYVENYNNSVNTKLWVYEPWLEAIGKDVPQTTEEFYEVCKLIVGNDLNGNGKNDEVALTGFGFSTGGNNGWFQCLMSAYIYAHGTNFLVAEDGQLKFAYTTDEWKEGLKYIKKFFDEGLIPVETLTQDNAQYEAVWKSSEMQLFSFAFYNMGGTDMERKANYIHIPALEGPEGVKNAKYKPATPKVGAVITADCENPEAAFLVCDYLCSEEMSITGRYGKRGENWDYWDEAKVDDKSKYAAAFPGYDNFFIAYDDAGFFSSQAQQNVSYIQNGPGMLGAYVLNAQAFLTTATTEEEQLAVKFQNRVNTAIMDCMKYGPDEVVSNLPMTADETQKASDIKASLDTYFYEITSQFLIGEKDIDSEWNNYLAELEKIGYKELLAAYQTAYDRTK